MSKFKQLKELINQIESADTQRQTLFELIESIEEDHIRAEFWINRQKRDIKVNENFVKKTVALLEQSNKELKNTNEELKTTNKELENSNEELERFAYIASHDLKTPLDNIISFTFLLEREIKNIDNPNALQYLKFIKLGGTRMNGLIRDVLEYSRLSNTEEECESIDLNVLVNKIIESISEHLKQRNAKIIINNILPTINFNPSKIFILFKNLIENGVKYNESKTPVIQISAEKKEDAVLLFFQDNGIGIKEEMTPKIFKMFGRLHRSDEYEGTGLGLSICKKIIENRGGKITLQSKLGLGSTFIIALNSAFFNQAIKNSQADS